MPKIIGDLRLYDLDELSALLGMHKKSLTEKYIKTGIIRARKFGVRWYVPEDALKEYFAGTDSIGGDRGKQEKSDEKIAPQSPRRRSKTAQLSRPRQKRPGGEQKIPKPSHNFIP